MSARPARRYVTTEPEIEVDWLPEQLSAGGMDCSGWTVAGSDDTQVVWINSPEHRGPGSQYSRAMTDNDPATDEAAIALAHSLLDSARNGDHTPLLSLIDQGAPVDLRDGSGNTPLMLAAYHGHAELVDELVARGADVDLANDRGQSPLAGVAFKGFTEVAQVLLDAGADPDLGAPSALETAKYFERAEIVSLIESRRR